MPRATDALNVAPLTVSDRTCAAMLGLEPRAFRDLLIRENIPHARIGRRVVARVELVLGVLDRMANTQVDVVESAPSFTADEEAARVLAELGLERSA